MNQPPPVALPLWCLTAPPSPRCEACHWIFGSLCSPTNPVPLPPRCAGALWILINVPYDSTGKHRANLPLRGRCRRQKGCISSRQRRGCTVFPPTRAVCLFSLARQGGCLVLSYWRPIIFEGRHHNPRATGASDFRTLRLQACQTSAQRAVNPHARKGVSIKAPPQPSRHRRVKLSNPQAAGLSNLGPKGRQPSRHRRVTYVPYTPVLSIYNLYSSSLC